MVVPLSCFSAVFNQNRRIELTLNETSGKLIKCKALLMKITKTASFFFLFLFQMLLIVLLSVSKRGAVVISLENRSELPNRRSKEDKKKKIDFCVLSLAFRKN